MSKSNEWYGWKDYMISMVKFDGEVENYINLLSDGEEHGFFENAPNSEICSCLESLPHLGC